MQKCLLIAAVGFLAIGSTQAKGNAPSTMNWEDFKSFHAKMYVSDENEGKGKANFEKNAADVAAHNLAFEQGKVTYKKELNSFADLDPETFKRRNGFQLPKGPPGPKLQLRSISKRNLPSSFDWRNTGKVSAVKNQGDCGSCWAFSANGAIESQVLIRNGPNTSLSEQQLVSCDTGDSGCNGGMYTRAWNYIKKAGGVQSTTDYRYTSGGRGVGSGTCQFTAGSSRVAQKITSFKDISGITDAQLMDALVNTGPISVAIDAGHMQTYSEGIYSCGTARLDHAVLLIGYGTTNSGKNYWIIKNSWGTNWGEKGFFKLARGASDCGITQWPAYPIL